jgi:hypothetical protein
MLQLTMLSRLRRRARVLQCKLLEQCRLIVASSFLIIRDSFSLKTLEQRIIAGVACFMAASSLISPEKLAEIRQLGPFSMARILLLREQSMRIMCSPYRCVESTVIRDTANYCPLTTSALRLPNKHREAPKTLLQYAIQQGLVKRDERQRKQQPMRDSFLPKLQRRWK